MVLQAFGVAQDIVRIIANRIEKASASIKGQSQAFPITVGLIQGDPLSPLLFLLSLEATLRVANLAELGIRLLSGEVLSDIEFADDVNLISSPIPNLQKQVDKLEKIWANLGYLEPPTGTGKNPCNGTPIQSWEEYNPKGHTTNRWQTHSMACSG